MNAAAAAGSALKMMMRFRPNLSDKEPSENEPTILATLKTPMTQPVCWSVSALAVRSNVGVHAAELQKTDPPMNSASARITIAREIASLQRLAPAPDRGRGLLRIQ